MEYLNKVEKFVLGYIWHEYLGKIYFSKKGSETAEDFLARTIVSEIIPEKARYRQEAERRIKEALKKLQEYWMIEVGSYQVTLTSYGQTVANSIKKEDYEKWKSEIAKGSFE